MIRMTGMHRTDEGDVIHLVCNVREQIADFDAALSTGCKIPAGAFQKNLFIARTIACFRMIERHLFSVIGNQLGLVIKRIDV